MTAAWSIRPLVAVLVPAAAVIPIRLSGRRPNLREAWTLVAAFAMFAVVVSMAPAVLAGEVLRFHLVTVLPGLSLGFRVDALGMAFALTASFLWILTSFYSIGYTRSLGEGSQTRYFMSFAGAMSGAMGVAFAADLFTLFVFYELITISTFPLVGHKQTPEARRGARIYLIYLLGTSLAFFFLAIALTYFYAGRLGFSPGGMLPGEMSGVAVAVLFALFMLGIAKAAMMPLHSWLPEAMVAPTPVSAFLHAVAVVKAGVFSVLRVVLFVFGTGVLKDLGLGTALLYVASFTIITASIVALKQDNLKRLLAYSTISQLSYIIFAVALLSADGVTGSIFHIVAHAFGKITLFLAAGSIYVAHHRTRVSELDGIGARMPFTMTAFAVASVSMIGIPPMGGFVSKWFMFTGSVDAGHAPFILVLATSTILNGCYFLPIVYRAFFRAPSCEDLSGGRPEGIKEAPLFMVVPLVVTAIGTVVIFFWPTLFLDLARLAASATTGG